MIPFNKPPTTKCTEKYVSDALRSGHMSGDGAFTQKCSEWLSDYLPAEHALLTTSGSHALDMAARLCDLSPGDEVIMPSYTFSSTANAFLSVGASIVFVDIRPDTMNMDENLIEAAITSKTKVIVPVHYAGVACEMNTIQNIADKYDLFVVEDAAQALTSEYYGKRLGMLSDFGCFSFHETKNFSMGEGGAIIMHNDELAERAEILREKGTNRSKFFRGQIDKYSWVDYGSSYLPSDILAACLWSQLEVADEITADRLRSWNAYYDRLRSLGSEDKGFIELPFIPTHCSHNAHMFYIKVRNMKVRSTLISFLKERGITASYHYVPLHSSQAGMRYCRFHGEDKYTTNESDRLLRLPMYYGLKEDEIDYVVNSIDDFFGK